METDFFIVNVGHGQPKNNSCNILKNADFPTANRQSYQYPGQVDIYLKKYKHLKNWEKYANFQLLLYLAKLIDIHVKLLDCNSYS